MSGSTSKSPLNLAKSFFKSQAGLLDADAWHFFFGYYQGRFSRLAAYAAFASFQSLLILPVLYLIRFIFDTAIPRGDVKLLIIVGGGIFLIRLLNSFFVLAMRSFVLKIIKDVIHFIRRDLIDVLYRLSSDFLGRADKDKIQTQIVQDTERVDAMSNALLSNILPAVVTSGALLIVLFFLNWGLVLAIIPIVPLVWLSARFTGGYVKKEVFVFQRAFEVFNSGILFVLRHMTLTKVQAFETEESARQTGHIQDLRDKSTRMAMSYAIHRQVQQSVTGLVGVVILVIGGASVASGIMTLGEFVAFYVAAGFLNGSVNSILGGLTDIITGNESLVTLRTLIMTKEVEPYSGSKVLDFSGGVELRNVSFRYEEAPVLENVSLNVPPHANIAIIGPNGAGKSTLLSLLLGFNKPQTGAVYADGILYDELDLRALRRSIGVVLQQPTFFSGTVLENISYGLPEATKKDVVRAARLALADPFIAELPDGYETQIGDGGVRLSGGECQRLAIARALLGDPKILILDEPTNHLDAQAVDDLMAGLVAQKNCPTIITISHDSHVLSYVKQVYRISNGGLTLCEDMKKPLENQFPKTSSDELQLVEGDGGRSE